MTLQRILTWIGLVVGVLALFWQFYLTFESRTAAGDNLLGILAYFFTFFTILTNLFAVLCYLAYVTRWRWLGWFDTNFARALAAGSIAMVSIYYIGFLASLVEPNIAGQFQHYVAPWIFVVWWILTPGHGTLRHADLPRMLIYPLAYLVIVMIRGAIVAEYPYPILRANELGYGQVAINCVMMLVGFVVLYAVTIAIDRQLAARTATGA